MLLSNAEVLSANVREALDEVPDPLSDSCFLELYESSILNLGHAWGATKDAEKKEDEGEEGEVQDKHGGSNDCMHRENLNS